MTVAWRSRIVGSGEEAPDQLLANPRNWRIHPKAQQDALGSMLDRVGWVDQVLVNRTTGHLVDGHLRVELALSRGEGTVPVSYVELEEEEEALVLASLDPLSAMAATDPTKLAELLSEVTIDQADLEAMLKGLLPATPKAGLTDPDAVPEVPDEPYVQPGDLWLLGDHRLLCGDSTKAEDVERLLDGAKPALMVTDPPYGVNYDPSLRSRNRTGKVANDDRVDWQPAWALAPSGVAYVWHSGIHVAEVARSLEAVGYSMRAHIIWAKPSLVMGRGHYHWQHEPCWYAVRDGATAGWVGDRKQSTLWTVDHIHPSWGQDDRETVHGTQKPVEVMARPMRNHSGDVFDPFLGSGTTLIATEQEGRTCYAMDIEPKYVQVAKERWEAFTGREATRG
jgi:DNA modification methylase